VEASVSEVVDKYVRLKMKGMVMRDQGGYDLKRGEMNPSVFEEFVGLVLERGVSPAIWEPFAGHTGHNRNLAFVDEVDGLELIQFDIEPHECRVRKADSTMEGPGRFVGGVFFHPPYYGSSPLSREAGEMSVLCDEVEYRAVLTKAAGLARMSLEPNGLVCAVGRDYRHDGKRIRMDVWMVEIFDAMGMRMVDVWQSEPDVAVILEAGDV
jgi:hypothetical protein